MDEESRRVAEVFARVWDRFVCEEKLRLHGDELEIAEFVLRAWDRADPDAIELQALTVLLIGFLPPLMLAKLDETSRFTGWDAASMQELVGRTGIAAWCRKMGFSLQAASAAGSQRPAGVKRFDLDQAKALIRERRERSSVGDELAVHDVLDRSVNNALPLGRDLLNRIERGDGFADEESLALVKCATDLIATSRAAAYVVPAAIAWEPADPAGAENWFAYLVTALRVGVALGIYAETGSAERRAVGALFDHEDLALLALKAASS